MAWPLESGIIFFLSFCQTAVTSINNGNYNDFTASEVDVPLEIRPKAISSAFLNEVWKPTETTLPERESSMAATQSLAQWIDKRSTEHYIPEVQPVQSITSVTATSMSFVNIKITTNSVTNRHFHSTPTPMLINRGYFQNSTSHLKRMEESRPLPRPYKMNTSLTKTNTVRSLLNSNKESKIIKPPSDMVEFSVSAVDTLVTMGLLVTEMDLTPENMDYQFITKITDQGKDMISVSRIFEDYVSKYEEVVKVDEFVTVSREVQLTSSLDETVKNSLNTGSILLTPSLHHSSKESLPRIMVLSESKAHRPVARNLVDLGSRVGFGSNTLNMPDYIASSNMFIMEALTSDRSFHDSTFLAEDISSIVPSTDITEPASLVISANTVSLPLLPRSNSVSEFFQSSAKGQLNDEGFLEFSKSFVSGFRSAYNKFFRQGDDKIETHSKYIPNYAPRKLLVKGPEIPNGVLAYVSTVLNISSDSEVNTNNLIPDSSSTPLTTATVATEEMPNGVLAFVSTVMNFSSNSEEDTNNLISNKSSAKYSEQAITSVTAMSNFAIPVFNKSVMKDLVELRNVMNTQAFNLDNIHNQYLNQTSLEKLQRNTLLLFVVGAIVIQIQLILGLAIIWWCLLRKFRKCVNNKPTTISDEHSKVVNFRNAVKLTEVNDEISVAGGQDEEKPAVLEGSCTVPTFVTTAL